MRAVRILITLIFVIVLGGYIYVEYTKEVDTTVPHLVCDVKEIEVSVNDGDEALLKHIKAYDKKDGDLTDKVIVEKTSAFISFGKMTATFVVCDTDCNVSKINVPVVYTDYENPRITLKDDLVFLVGKGASVKECIKVTDKIDGDITNRAIIIDKGTDINVPGEYPLTIKVTNSKSYTYTMDIDLVMTEQLENGYSIELTENLIYKKIGEKVDYKSFIGSVGMPPNSADKEYSVSIDSSEVNTVKAGVYNVYYKQIVEGEVKSITRLIVCYE